MAAALHMSGDRIDQARTVLREAPDLVDAVIVGGRLDDSYAEAMRRKQRRDQFWVR
jgi:hypothetical protein